ncbi:hypothetical protein Tco_0638632, partial [Tanacetum coccineum]
VLSPQPQNSAVPQPTKFFRADPSSVAQPGKRCMDRSVPTLSASVQVPNYSDPVQ